MAISDASLQQVVRRHFDRHAISKKDTNRILPNFAGQLSNHFMLSIVKTNPKKSIRQFVYYHALGRNHFLFAQELLLCSRSLNLKSGCEVWVKSLLKVG